MLHIAVLRLRFHLEGCGSLKDKRQRLSGLRDRFGRLPGIAVCESEAHDSLAEAEWSFVAAGGSRQITSSAQSTPMSRHHNRSGARASPPARKHRERIQRYAASFVARFWCDSSSLPATAARLPRDGQATA